MVHKGKDRFAVDLSSRNALVAHRPFRYETVPGLVAQLYAGDHLVSWDIKDAFHHIRMLAADRLRLVFRVSDHVFLPNVLPFGLKLAPWAFTQLMRPVVTALRRLGCRRISFCDDSGGAPPGSCPCFKNDANAGRRTPLALFASLGVQVHAAKGVAIGTHALPLLGFLVHTVRRLILLPPGGHSSLLVAARRLSSAACFSSLWVRRKALQRFCGLAVSCSLAISAARLRLHHLYVAQRGRAGWCHLRHGALAELAWWRRLRRSREVGRALWQPHLGALPTDASPYGWGGHDQNLVPARGFFSPGVQRMHINVHEFEAVTLSLMSLGHLWDPGGGVLDLRIDNKGTKYVISNMSTRSRALHWARCRLRMVLVRRGLCLRGSWLSSAANFRAEYLSRVTDRTDWRLSPAVFADLDARWGPHIVDRFASETIAQVPRFNSLWLCPGIVAVEAFRQWWGADSNFVNPPFGVVDQVLDFIEAHNAAATVVLPVWQAQPWWSQAVATIVQAFLLPPHAGLFSPGSLQVPRRRTRWRVAAFRFVPFATRPRLSACVASRPASWNLPPLSAALVPLPSSSSANRH